MTVVLALRCADGVVMASDSQITDSARGLSYPAQKLHTLGSHAAWGGSGSRAVLYDVEQIFKAPQKQYTQKLLKAIPVPVPRGADGQRLTRTGGPR